MIGRVQGIRREGIGMGECPTGPTCPGIYQLSDSEYVVIGDAYVTLGELDDVKAVVGNGEGAVKISADVLQRFLEMRD